MSETRQEKIERIERIERMIADIDKDLGLYPGFSVLDPSSEAFKLAEKKISLQHHIKELVNDRA